MNPQAAQSLAVAAACLAGGVFGLLAFDLLIYLLLGNTATVSHGMYELGQNRSWVPPLFVIIGFSITLILAWHFWWS